MLIIIIIKEKTPNRKNKKAKKQNKKPEIFNRKWNFLHKALSSERA
jgi:hypothetical protein